MKIFLEKIKTIFRDKVLRKKIFFVFFALAIFRIGASIPISGIDQNKLRTFLAGNQFFGLLNIFSGGGLSKLSIFMLGLSPLITASIVMQLLTMIVPRLKEIYQEEGEAGRKRFEQYSRFLSIPLAIVQGFGLLTLLERQGIFAGASVFDRVVSLIVVTAGATLLMWVGELITEYGIGNGISLLIFAGIVAGMPGAIQRILFVFSVSQIPLYFAVIVASVLVLAGVIVVSEAERPIPISYAKQVRGNKVYGGVSTHLPLRINQAGVIPIIFAISILLFPQMIINVLGNFNGPIARGVVAFLSFFAGNVWLYGTFYFILVFFFTYFYTNVTFDPETIATNLQKSGAFVPGIRPGRPTAEYLAQILNRITLIGALFLGTIAVLPMVTQVFTGSASLAIGGTALLIVVSVILETIKEIDAQVVMREYD